MQNQENNLREMTPLKVNTFDLNSTSLIEASAGTGKTYTISNLVIRLLLGQLNKEQNTSLYINQGNPLSIENILIVTFTNAAASDLRARILEKIHDTRILFETVGKGASLVSLDCDENLKELLENYLNSENQQELAKKYARLLNRAERNIDNAPISTIHSFCNRALNQVYAFESGKAFNVQLIQEQESNALQDEAMFAVWRDLFYTDKLGDKRATLLEILGTQDPTSLKDTINLLKSVRNLNPKDGYFGYAIYNLKKQHPNNTLEKELTDLIKAYEKIIKELLEGENADLLWQIHECFKKHTVVTESNQSPFYESVTGFTDEIYALFTNIEDLKDLETEDFNKELVKLLFASGKATKKILSKGNDNISLISRARKDSRFKLPLEAQEFEENLYQLVNNLEEVRDKLDLNSKTIWYVLSILCINKLDSLFIRDNVISNDELLRQLAIVLTVDKKRGDNLAKLLRNQYPVAMIDEFQDTDPIQFEIFNKLYLEDKKQEQSKAVCYLIGDPKQSIYAFRNADINSYNKAKAKVEKLYTLDTNFRSSRNIIEGVNAIFEQDVPGFEARPLDCEADFIPSNIDFMRVNYPKEDKKLAGSCRFYFDDEYNDDDFYKRPISNYVNTLEFENPKTKKEQYQVAIARALACDVVKVLTHGVLDKSSDRTKKRKIKPSDIAILVKSGQESSQIQTALEEVGLKSVYFSDRSSVIGGDVKTSYGSSEYKPSCESVNIIYFMEAMCNNSNVSLVNRLLTCSLLRDNSKEIVLNTEDDNFDKEIRLLHDCYLKWEKHGFISAFTHYLQSHDGIKSMLDTEGGERALSNYYQIAELIQSIDAKVIGPQAQLIWFKSVALESDSKKACFSEDETKKHLESEQELIKIYTVHMSKGLQYPIVFLPYFYELDTSKTDTKLKVYDVNSSHLTLLPQDENFKLGYKEEKYIDESGKEKTRNKLVNMTLTNEKSNGKDIKSTKEIVLEASLQEKVRLLYVALTRAQAANFIYLNNLKGTRVKVFNRIINPKAEDGTLKAVSNLDLFKPLYKEHLKADELVVDKNEYKDYLAKEKALNNKETSSLSVNTLNAGDIDKSYTISSYSTITSGNHNHMFTEQNGENLSSDPKVQVEDSPSAELLQFTFTKGNIAGDFLHELMEYLLSRTNFDKNDDGCLLKFVEETTQNKKYGSLLKPYDQDISTFNADFTDWLSSIVHANLGIVDSNSHPLSLSCLTSDKCACELEYFMPCKQFKMDEFNLICDEFYQSEVEKFGDAIQADLPMLKANDFKGFMKGSIDLVANFETNIGNQYFLIDYKSNFLGGGFKDYSPSQMFKSIFTSRYDVQILIYSVALHRFLKTIVKDYDYEKDFGGVMYLFLRGLQKGTDSISTGIYQIKPKFELVERLDKLFEAEE
ncbi:MAG: UvrD-helicase domain-containing protein [Succinivibrio sp.]|nr:UvrD-helicase domain-containing protein [Succinivibrio sp.]